MLVGLGNYNQRNSAVYSSREINNFPRDLRTDKVKYRVASLLKNHISHITSRTNGRQSDIKSSFTVKNHIFNSMVSGYRWADKLKIKSF